MTDRSLPLILQDPSLPARAGVRAWAGALVEVTKPGIARLVTLTAGVGFALVAMGRADLTLSGLLLAAIGCSVGTYLSAAGANALNQWLEAERDGVMRRTCARPLPSGRLRPAPVLVWGATLAATGIATLLVFNGPVAALLSLFCAASYVMVYTPLKTRTIWNTLIGTLPGAVPAMIGTVAASGRPGLDALAEPIGWVLFAVMTVWQIPHFLAIAWMYRDDYAAGGYRMLPTIDPTGRWTGAVSVACAAGLVPVSLALVPAAPGLVSWAYAVSAVLTGAWLIACSVLFLLRPARRSARRLFFASIIQLPVLLLASVIDGAAHAFF